MRWRRLTLIVFAAVLAAVAATAVCVAVNMLSSSTAGWYRAMERHPLRWVIVATGDRRRCGAADVVGAAVVRPLAWRSWFPQCSGPETWVVDRPAEVRQVVAALGRGGTVGITTAVQGAGGFGKTTIAKMVRCDRRVLRRFRGRVYWVTVGRDAPSEGLALLVNALIARIDPGRALTSPDAGQAAEQLAAVLASGPGAAADPR